MEIEKLLKPKQIPLLYMWAMVNAKLKKAKTETRRLDNLEEINEDPNRWEFVRYWDGHAKFVERGNATNEKYVKCRYGNPGDILWQRETHYAYGHWSKVVNKKRNAKKGKPVDTESLEFNDLTIKEGQRYRYEDNAPEHIIEGNKPYVFGWYKRPSLFMPKQACRASDKVISIHCERLLDIDNIGAIDEGILTLDIEWVHKSFPLYAVQMDRYNGVGRPPIGPSPRDRYLKLWEQLNGLKSITENHYVFVIKFEPIKDHKLT